MLPKMAGALCEWLTVAALLLAMPAGHWLGVQFGPGDYLNLSSTPIVGRNAPIQQSADASAAPHTAGQVASPVTTGATGLTGTTGALTQTVFFPGMWRDKCLEPGPAELPFGIEIAALHQVALAKVASALAPAPAASMRSHLDAAYPTLLARLQESGAGWTRIYLAWRDIEPLPPAPGQPPAYDWSWYDPKLQAVAGTGVHIMGILASPPVWAANPQCAPLSPAAQADFMRFIANTVTRYKDAPYGIKHWEIINEPDYAAADGDSMGFGCWGKQGAQYAQMLAQAYRTVKSADPEATVILGGLAYDAFTEYPPYDPRGFYRYFIDDVMAAGGGDSADGLAFHYFPDWHFEWERWVAGSLDRQFGLLAAPACGPNVYDKRWNGPRYEPWGPDLIAKLTHFSGRMRTCYGVDKPIWVNELGQHGYSDRAPTLTDQARYVIQGNVRGLAGGAVNVIWYALSTPDDDIEEELLFKDLSPKPGFYAFKTLAAELSGYQYARVVRAPDVEGYVFTAPCAADQTVAWGSGLLAFGASSLRKVDYMGQVTMIRDGGPGDEDRVADGTIKVRLTADPVFLKVGDR
jgi:hypothetical protein